MSMSKREIQRAALRRAERAQARLERHKPTKLGDRDPKYLKLNAEAHQAWTSKDLPWWRRG